MPPVPCDLTTVNGAAPAYGQAGAFFVGRCAMELFSSVRMPASREGAPSLELVATLYLQIGLMRRAAQDAAFALADGDTELCRRYLLNIERLAGDKSQAA